MDDLQYLLGDSMRQQNVEFSLDNFIYERNEITWSSVDYVDWPVWEVGRGLASDDDLLGYGILIERK